MSIVVKIVGMALVILGIATSGLIPGISVSSFATALLVAVILAIINFFIKPILIILTLPLNILTFGLFTLVLNALLLWFTATLVSGFEVAGFVAAFLGALLISVANWLIDKIV